MEQRQLGRTALRVSALGYGAFKIGRNEGAKYPHAYALPTDDEAEQLIHAILDLGITYFDTAPAYGLSEERLGRALAGRADVAISTKVGETFENGRSTYDFSAAATRASVERSLRRLRRDALDLVFVHAPREDADIATGADVVPTLQALRQAGQVRAIGFSGKTISAAIQALAWSDALMIEYHEQDQSHAGVLRDAAARGVGVVIKKGLASGRLAPQRAIPFVLNNPAVASLVVGGLSLERFRENVRIAESCRMTEHQDQ